MSIRDDLSRRIHDRLYTWANDSADLYNMGGLSSRETTEDLLSSVIVFLVSGVVLLEMDEKALYKAMHEMIAQRKRRKAESDEL